MALMNITLKRVLVSSSLIAGWVGFLAGPAAAIPHPESADSYDRVPPAATRTIFVAVADSIASVVEDHVRTQEFSAAVDAALELTTLCPQYARGWVLLGYCLSLTSDFTGSNKAYERALEFGAYPNVVYSRMAYNDVRLGAFDDAKARFNSILESNPNDSEALKQMGYIEGKLENYNDAAVYLRRALELAPDDSDLILTLARIEAKREGSGSVRELLEKALLLEPNNPEILGKIGVIYMKEANYKDALPPLRKLVELEPGVANNQRNFGAVCFHLGDKENALFAFEKARSLDGKMVDLYGPLADCYIATGKTTEALEIIREGIREGVQLAWLYSLWGNLLENAKDYDGAIAKFSESARLGQSPWSEYAEKQIARQAMLKKRSGLMAGQMQE
jgi:tetratricopeptide (TPR) repeat protein